MNEIEYAITNFEEFLEADIGQGDLHMCSAEIALAALREQAEREKGCEACGEAEKTGFANMGSRIYLERNETGYSISDRYDNAVEVCYCPMCGKSLKEVKQDGRYA